MTGLKTSETALQKAIDSGYVALTENCADLFSRSFGPAGVFLHRRKLSGDFNAVAQYLRPADATHKADFLRGDVTKAAQVLTGAGQEAARKIIEDIDLFARHDYQPILRVIGEEGYSQNPDSLPFQSIHAYHADGGDDRAGRVFAAYTDPVTEGLLPDQAQRCVDIEEYRRALLEKFAKPGAQSEDSVKSWLMNDDYTRFYEARPGAEPYSFSPGDIFRHACMNNLAGVAPHIHRAPPMPKGCKLKLLLVGSRPRPREL